MNQEARVEELERVAGVEPDGEAPCLVVYWPEHETPETRAEAARVRGWYRKHGVRAGASGVVVNWDLGDDLGTPLEGDGDHLGGDLGGQGDGDQGDRDAP